MRFGGGRGVLGLTLCELDLSQCLHRCRKSNTYKSHAPISKPRHINFSNLIMQKYQLSRQTHKMTIVLRLKLYKILMYTARIAYENTYDMRAIFSIFRFQI